MTRTATNNTAVRRRVDVNDGRLVIRKIVVETPEIVASAAPAVEPVAAAPAAEATATRRRRLPAMRPAKRIG